MALIALPTRAPLVSLPVLTDIAAGLAVSHAAMPLRLDGERHLRGSVRLLATAAYDAWLLRWPPGSNVEPHDHGVSQGVFVVVTGQLDEVRWSGNARRIRRLHAGEATTVPPGVVHDVVGVGSMTAVSVHVYSPPLCEMRFYDAAATQVVSVEAVEPSLPSLDGRQAAAALHPSTGATAVRFAPVVEIRRPG